jgi:hypothetical protein
MEQTGLEVVRAGARIEFSRPQGYRELLEIVKAHGFDLRQQAGSRLEPHEVAERWYDDVYLPAVAALHREELPADYAYTTVRSLPMVLRAPVPKPPPRCIRQGHGISR